MSPHNTGPLRPTKERETYVNGEAVTVLTMPTEQMERLISALESLATDTGNVVRSVSNAARFTRRWGPWIIAAIGSWVGISPTAIKAVLAATGHPTP